MDAWRREDIRLPAAAGTLAFLSCLAQVLLWPQPQVLEDAAAYHEIGGRFRDALGPRLRADGFGAALGWLRPCAVLFPSGLVYGLLRAIGDSLHVIYVAQAAATSGSIALLTRAAQRLAGNRAAAITAGLALLYPTFPLICGIVRPEPFTLLCWTWSLERFTAAQAAGPHPWAGRRRAQERPLAVSGLALGLGMALHPLGLWGLLLALAVLLAPLAGRLRDASVRRRWGAFALGLLPVLVTSGVARYASAPGPLVLAARHGFPVDPALAPLGFWSFLDSDGWPVPARLHDGAHARGLARAEHDGAAAGTTGRLLFTLRFVASNLGTSLAVVLRNAHRLFAEPENPLQRDWILPHAVQTAWHRALFVLFLLAIPDVASRSALAVLLPAAALIVTCPLGHVLNRHAVPAMPFVLLGAALTLGRLVHERQRALLLALAASMVGSVVVPADLVATRIPPSVARALLLAVHWGGLAAAFVVVARRWAVGRRARALTLVAALVVAVPAIAVAWGDPAWRDYAVGLGGGARHAIALGPEGLESLDRARAAFVLLDLHVPDGDPSGLRLEFDGGPVVQGRELQPLMTLGEHLGRPRSLRDPRTFRQWWGLPWRAGQGRDGHVAVTVRGREQDHLYGDLDDRAGTAWSLGEWPRSSMSRLLHDGEYRLPGPRVLQGTRASRTAERPLPGSLSVRLVALEDDAGGAAWEMAPASGNTVVTGVWARVSKAARADLDVPAGTFRVDLTSPSAALGPSGEMRYLPTGDQQGWLVLRIRATRGEPIRLRVRPVFDLSASLPFFVPELRRDPPPLPLDWGGFPYAPPLRIVEVREPASWRPRAIH